MRLAENLAAYASSYLLKSSPATRRLQKFPHKSMLPFSVFFRQKTFAIFALLLIFGFLIFWSGCRSKSRYIPSSKPTSKPLPKESGSLPYEVDGKIYRPMSYVKAGFSQTGTASWYGPKFHGKETSNKEIYDMDGVTAAHKTLPFQTLLRVENLENGRKVQLRVNDRGPFVGDRILDLSRGAARTLGVIEKGTARVRITVLKNSGDANRNSKAESNYAVQLAVFSDMKNAEKAGRKIEDGRVRTFDKNGKPFYRILVGSFPDYEQAIERRDQVRERGYPEAFIVRAE